MEGMVDQCYGCQLVVSGTVQGVGFRPYVYRLASELGLHGWVRNGPRGVVIEIDGQKQVISRFLERLHQELPTQARIDKVDIEFGPVRGHEKFRIIRSESAARRSFTIMPDMAMCSQCRQEISDPTNRRYRYPFTSCTNCGPRYSIIGLLPYDRENTSMRPFSQCRDCLGEFIDPKDRRFHSQPNCCPRCGPRMELMDKEGNSLGVHDDAIKQAAEAIKEGLIVAVKGLGGFHLICDAGRTRSVNLLRERKQRPTKPFAVMFPSIEQVKKHVWVSEADESLLLSSQSPIVLMKRKEESDLSELIAPGNPYVGVMIPYTPLHQVLLDEIDRPVIATSGNVSGEPICVNDRQALTRLRKIADLFLTHNRKIMRPLDDSVARIIEGRPQVLRRARGYVPAPIRIKEELPEIIAVGGQLKNTIAFTKDSSILLSQHLGDVQNAASYDLHKEMIRQWEQFFGKRTGIVACDAHPEYLTTRWAHERRGKAFSVQHHFAHVCSVMAEYGLQGPVLGIAWDGTGFGDDGNIWGSEFLVAEKDAYKRVAHLRYFPLIGGEQAIIEPRRALLGLLVESMGENAFETPVKDMFSKEELHIIKKMVENGINIQRTSSMGRLFDGIAALLGMGEAVSFEGEAAMKVEYLCIEDDQIYPYSITEKQSLIIDWEPMVMRIAQELREGIQKEIIARRFHNTLIEIIVEIACMSKLPAVVLTGGCFQNKILLEESIKRLQEKGIKVYWNEKVPPNDGGLAVGQVMAAARCV